MTSEAAIKYVILIQYSVMPLGHMTKLERYILLSGHLMATTSEAAKEYMVNTISVGIRPIRMKLGEDVGLEASCNINYF